MITTRRGPFSSQVLTQRVTVNYLLRLNVRVAASVPIGTVHSVRTLGWPHVIFKGYGGIEIQQGITLSSHETG